MNSRFLPLSLVLFSSLPVCGQQAPASPEAASPAATEMKDEDVTKVLEEIIRLQREFAKTKKDLGASALERFKAGAASEAAAQEFYLAAYKVVNIDRRPTVSKEAQAERADGDWQRHAADALGEGPVLTALRMQLHLLAMTLENAAKKEEQGSEATVKAVRSLMQSAAALLSSAADELERDAGGKQAAGKKKRQEEARNGERAARELQRQRTGVVKLMRQPVTSTVFAEAYNLAAYMDAPEHWPRSAADFETAYEGAVIPWFRANKKTDLPALWDEYLHAAAVLEQMSRTPDEFLRWGAREFKALTWKKWLDLLSNNVNPTAAMQELGRIVRENPSHPDLKNWIADLAHLSEAMGGPKFDGL